MSLPGTSILAKVRHLPIVSLIFRRLDPHQKDVIQLLKKTFIFGELTDQELVHLLHLLHERTFAAGETIFNEGEPGFGLYVVLRGEVVIGKLDHSGKGKVAKLPPGEAFGEVSFIDGSGRSATATASEKTELLGFYHTELFDLMKHNPVLASKILLALAKQMGMRMRAMLQLIQN